MVEIGPGLGSLTLAILEAGASVTAVEIDVRLAARLPGTATAHGVTDGALQVVAADALRVQLIIESIIKSWETGKVINVPAK